MPSPKSLNPHEETPESAEPAETVDRNVVEMDDAPGSVIAHDEEEDDTERVGVENVGEALDSMALSAALQRRDRL